MISFVLIIIVIVFGFITVGAVYGMGTRKVGGKGILQLDFDKTEPEIILK